MNSRATMARNLPPQVSPPYAAKDSGDEEVGAGRLRAFVAAILIAGSFNDMTLFGRRPRAVSLRRPGGGVTELLHT